MSALEAMYVKTVEGTVTYEELLAFAVAETGSVEGAKAALGALSARAQAVFRAVHWGAN